VNFPFKTLTTQKRQPQLPQKPDRFTYNLYTSTHFLKNKGRKMVRRLVLGR